MGIFAMGWFFAYGSDQHYRITVYAPYAAIVNIMFSWVFRKAKLGVFTIIPPSNDVTSNTIGLRNMRNAQSAFVFKPAAVFVSTKDLESNSNNDEFQTGRDASLHGYQYDDRRQFEYGIQGHVNATTAPVRIGVEQVVELVSDTSDGARERVSGISQYH